MNNRGFAITSIIYLLLLLFLILVMGILMMLGSQQTILDRYKLQVLEKLDEPVSEDKYVQEDLVLWYDAIINYDHIQQGIINDDLLADLADNDDGSLVNFASEDWDNRYLHFAGDDEYVTTSFSADTFTADDDFSLEIYFQMNEVRADSMDEANSSVLLGNFDGAGYGITWATYDEDDSKYELQAGLRNSAGEVFTAGHEISDFRSYYHVAMVYSNMYNEMRFYVNGTLIEETSALYGGYSNGLGDLGIGLAQVFDENFAADYTDMKFFSARVYDRALPHNDILRNYAVDNARYD